MTNARADAHTHARTHDVGFYISASALLCTKIRALLACSLHLLLLRAKADILLENNTQPVCLHTYSLATRCYLLGYNLLLRVILMLLLLLLLLVTKSILSFV